MQCSCIHARIFHVYIYYIYIAQACCVACSSLWEASVQQRVSRFEELNFSDNHVGDEGKWKIWRFETPAWKWTDESTLPPRAKTIFLSFQIHEDKLGCPFQIRAY